MLHASKTWPLTKPNLQHLQQNDRPMIRHICNVRLQDIVTTRSNELLAWLGIEDPDLILKERRLRWYGHVERSNGVVKTAFDIQDIVTTRSNELLAWLGIEDPDLILKERRLRWYGHVERSNGVVKTAFDIQADGKRGPGRPKMTWKQLTERDCSGSSRLSTLMIDISGDLV